MKRHYPEVPVPAVAAVIYHADRWLLVKRRNPPSAGKWSVPGGVQEVGERVYEAVKREAREETGLAITRLELLEAGDVIRHDDEGRVAYHYVILYYLAVPVGGELRAGDDVSEVGWFTLDEVKTLRLPDGMMDILLNAAKETTR
mgnify:CR=1 FL=1